MAMHFNVTPQRGLLKSGQNETFGSTLKNFHGAFAPHLYPDIYTYLGSHTDELWAKNHMKIFFQKKNCM